MTPEEGKTYLARLDIFRINLFWLFYCRNLTYNKLSERINNEEIPWGNISAERMPPNYLRTTYMPKIRLALGIQSNDPKDREVRIGNFCDLITQLCESGEIELDNENEIIIKLEIDRSVWSRIKRFIRKHVLLVVSVFVLIVLLLLYFSNTTSIQNLLPCTAGDLSSEIFPGLNNSELFIGPPERKINAEEYFSCEVTTIPDTQTKAIKFTYDDLKTPNKYAYFGVGPLNGFDATLFNSICIRAFSEDFNQGIWLDIKDEAGEEGRELITFEESDNEELVCVELERYANRNVNLEQLDNVNISFNNKSGTSEIWLIKIFFRE